jgi:hypothetical protein
MSTAVQWYYARDGAQQGPVSEEELQRLAQSGALRPHDLVWRDGMAQWQPAQQATPFFPAAAAVAPPLPPQSGYAPPPPAAYPNQPGAHYAPPGYGQPGAAPYPYPQAKPIGEDAGMRMLIPVGRSGWAIAAGYLGLFSVLGCVAPISIIISIIAIRDIKAHPDRHGMGRAIFGLVMGILGTGILVMMVIGMMAGRPSGRF